MQIHISPHDKTPVYRQIQQQIARAIVDRDLHPGELLQPEEELAAQLVVSPKAVRKAYQGLQSEGLCDGSEGKYRITAPDFGMHNGSGTDLALTLLRKELLTAELETARKVQQRLMPPPEVQGSAWTLSARSYPAGALAGDFFEFHQSEEDVLDIVIADVAGKGLAAALIMATAKALVPVAAAQDNPGRALAHLNRRLLPLLGAREFVALAYARLQPQSGILEIANAGLPDPHLLRHSGELDTLAIDGNRLPLGIKPGIRYSTARYFLEPGDRLLLFTDGMPEARDRRGEPLGYEGFAQLATDSLPRPRDGDNGSPGDSLDRLLEAVGDRTGSILEDDWTAVLLEYRQS